MRAGPRPLLSAALLVMGGGVAAEIPFKVLVSVEDEIVVTRACRSAPSTGAGGGEAYEECHELVGPDPVAVWTIAGEFLFCDPGQPLRVFRGSRRLLACRAADAAAECPTGSVALFDPGGPYRYTCSPPT